MITGSIIIAILAVVCIHLTTIPSLVFEGIVITLLVYILFKLNEKKGVP
jgi:hypothetical protein